MPSIDIIIDDIIRKEGSYSDDANDSGGKTCWGITEAVARANGYHGDMRELSKDFARSVYYRLYVVLPQFDKVLLRAPLIAAELVDTGVNMGIATAGKFLQQSLNAFNGRGKYWPDLVVDGGCGAVTLKALTAYLSLRGSADGEAVMLKALNGLQAARYIELSQNSDKKNEDFVYGWIKNRVFG